MFPPRAGTAIAQKNAATTLVRIDVVQLVRDTGPQLTLTERIRAVLDQLMVRPDHTIDGEVVREDGDG
jgi:hypothetical protein